MAQHNDLGRWGEQLAAEYLKMQGWYIRHMDWHHKHRDLDIVAIDDESTLLLIVEVKTRSTDEWGDPDEAIDLEKQNNIIRATAAYQRAFRLEGMEVRYDTISIVGTPDMPLSEVSIVHKQAAFDVTSNFFYREQQRKRAFNRHRPGQWN